MKATKDELGNFYFILVNNVFKDVLPQTATKLIMLSTYLNYDNQLMKTTKTPMLKNDIRKILRLSKSPAYQFWNEVKNLYIIENDNGLFINENVNIFRHNIPKDSKYLQYQKIYISAVRELYKTTDVRKHKQLGYIFKLLPYINLEFNIFCIDPFVEELEQIEPLTMADFCDLINYDRSQSTRLQKELRSLTFMHKGNKEYLLSYVDSNDGINQNKMIFINPHILYNGSDYKKVEILGAFCKTNSKISRHSEELAK